VLPIFLYKALKIKVFWFFFSKKNRFLAVGFGASLMGIDKPIQIGYL
jgi:hypothetical protein